MKAAVLGGTGFIGSWIVRELASAGADVIAVGLPTGVSLPDGDHVTVASCDFSNTLQLTSILRGCDAVFHAGGYYPVFSVDRSRQIRRALDELRSTLKAVRNSDAKRFIFTSSPLALVEDQEALRRSTYHALKHLLHSEVRRWIDLGLPGIMIVPGGCFGPGDWKPTTGRIVVEVANRRMRFILEGIMNAVDVRDVARGQVLAMKFGRVGSVYQMGNWNGPCQDFLAIVAAAAHVPPPSIPVPYELAKALAVAGEWVQYIFHAQRPFLPQVGLDMARFGAFLDSSEAIRELGFRRRPIEETLKDTLEDFAQRGLITAPEELESLNSLPLHVKH